MIQRETFRADLRCDDNYRGVRGNEARVAIPQASNIAVAAMLTAGSWVDLDVSWAPIGGGPLVAFSPAVQLTTGNRSAKLAADELIGAGELVIRGATNSSGHSCAVYITIEREASPGSMIPLRESEVIT